MNDSAVIAHARLAPLKRRVMRSIWLVWGVRMLLHPRTLKSFAILAVILRSTQYVSYTNVVANAPSIFDVKHTFKFAQSAIAHTETTVFALLSLAMVFVAWLAFDFLYRRQMEAW